MCLGSKYCKRIWLLTLVADSLTSGGPIVANMIASKENAGRFVDAACNLQPYIGPTRFLHAFV